MDENINVKRELWRDALGWLKTILFALLFAWLFTNYVIVNASVPTGSMEGTIRVNDRIVAFRLSYVFSTPERFDIIVFRGAFDESPLYVKRIIGVPGDTVTIRDGRVFLNDDTEPLRDDFVQGEFFGNHGPYTVPEDGFFVLGDNRNNSVDSRHWGNPFVERGQIQGRVIFRYFPGFQNLTT
ncbi:MAG: signal peptidase I [Defluviitaleaceae bacterium]|nr:signal peptidase I [Defluviitaleaceae bacterium]